jgi:hypothetical protein
MSFEPAFMRDLEAFRAALAAVRTPAEWARFQARWFDDRPWPRRTPAALDGLRGDAGATVTTAGRTFTRGAPPGRPHPDARYAYFAALAAAYRVLLPAPEDQPGAAGSGVRHQCPACEWWTDHPGDSTCPGCGRTFLRTRLERPR